METATPIKISGINELVSAIQNANQFFLDQTQRQVNSSFTLRNCIIGYYMVEYEQNGEDRAEYGEKLVRKLSERLKKAGIRGLSYSTLHLHKQFYNTYPQLIQMAEKYAQPIDYKQIEIIQTLSGQFGSVSSMPSATFLSRLSFSHFIELAKADA